MLHVPGSPCRPVRAAGGKAPDRAAFSPVRGSRKSRENRRAASWTSLHGGIGSANSRAGRETRNGSGTASQGGGVRGVALPGPAPAEARAKAGRSNPVRPGVPKPHGGTRCQTGDAAPDRQRSLPGFGANRVTQDPMRFAQVGREHGKRHLRMEHGLDDRPEDGLVLFAPFQSKARPRAKANDDKTASRPAAPGVEEGVQRNLAQRRTGVGRHARSGSPGG